MTSIGIAKLAPASSSTGKGADFFLTKFWTQILADPACRHIVDWDATGRFLIIYNTDELMREVKNRAVCKQKDYDSFARQLRIYRWGRVRADDSGMQPWPETAKVWKHPRLTRESDVEEVGNITRNAPPKPNRGQGAVNISGVRKKATDGFDDDAAESASPLATQSALPLMGVLDPALVNGNLEAQTAELGLVGSFGEDVTKATEVTLVPRGEIAVPSTKTRRRRSASDSTSGSSSEDSDEMDDIQADTDGRMANHAWSAFGQSKPRSDGTFADSTTAFDLFAGDFTTTQGLLDSLASGPGTNGLIAMQPTRFGLPSIPTPVSVPMPSIQALLNGTQTIDSISIVPPHPTAMSAAAFASLPWLDSEMLEEPKPKPKPKSKPKPKAAPQPPVKRLNPAPASAPAPAKAPAAAPAPSTSTSTPAPATIATINSIPTVSASAPTTAAPPSNPAAAVPPNSAPVPSAAPAASVAEPQKESDLLLDPALAELSMSEAPSRTGSQDIKVE